VEWPSILLSGITLAAIYGLLAIGISITWSSLGMVNMAYGLTFAASGYGGWLMAEHFSEAGVLVILAGIVTGALIGVIVCLIAFIPIHDKPNFNVRGLIATLALSLIGTQLLLMTFGPQAKTLPPLFGEWQWEMTEELILTADQVGTLLSSLLLLGLTLAWMKGSRRGLEIRAMMMNPYGAAICGIGVRSTGIYVMAITGALAGLGAVLLCQTYFVSPFSGLTPMIKGVSVALCGGLGSVSGALIAACILGVVEALTTAYLGGQYVLITQFIVIIVILLIRPRGIAGMLDKAREA
jgi:branched-chain amino acid transport system permease protein